MDVSITKLGFVIIIELSAEAAKSCSKGAIAAFGPGEFHRVFGGGSKILLPWRECCLYPGAFHPGQSMNAELAKMTDTT